MAESLEPTVRHFTTRRSFAVLTGLLVLALYFIWAAYGAAPTSFRFFSETQNETMEGGGHGAGAARMAPEKFVELTEHFIEEFGLLDGSVKPRRADHGHRTVKKSHVEDTRDHGTSEHANAEPMAGMPAAVGHSETEREHMPAAGMNEGGGRAAAHTEIAMPKSGDMPMDERQRMAVIMTAAAAVAVREEENGHADHESAEPIDVYLMALRYSYTPQILRLDRDVPYRFRMMSIDVNHGASIHTGFAGHIMRRPARAMVEMVMTFTKPGEYMVYCTVYCGEGHDVMKDKIIVE